MRKLIFLLSMLWLGFYSVAQEKYPIIPFPNNIVPAEGEFEFKSSLTVELPPAFQLELGFLEEIFAKEYNTKILQKEDGRLQFIQEQGLGDEGYELTINRDKIVIEASTTAGAFYAIQTLRQLMELTGRGSYVIPAGQIRDRPAYEWRAFMLDEGRYFKGKEVVKTLLDQMALLKMNVFHWHLTEDQGWRIEIKKYPLLTEVGAWRDSTQVGEYPSGWSSEEYDSRAHGGFYTQEEVKEIVAYAAKRHITVVPEIEMPGHASAAIAAYPWLGANSPNIKVPTSFGIKEHAFNVADERVYGFIEDVLLEVMDLFPGDVIHIGGDEVIYEAWKESKEVNTLVKREGFETYSDVQIYFTNRISQFLENHGRRMMGWNEIMGNVDLEDQKGMATTALAKNSIVQFWKGEPRLLLEAIEKGYDVVNSDNTYTYLDYTHNDISLEKAYNFNPTPAGIQNAQEEQILGLGSQMWGEWIPRVTDLYRQTFPRIAAYAEVGWTRQSNKEFERFEEALEKLKQYWDKKGISYYDP